MIRSGRRIVRASNPYSFDEFIIGLLQGDLMKENGKSGEFGMQVSIY
jgi:hypothetical protein